MNQQDQELGLMPTFPKSLCVRSNLVSAEIVEKGIAFQEICGTKFAAEFMKREMISLDVVVRVLLRPSERRNCGACQTVEET